MKQLIDVGHSKIAHWVSGQGPDLLFVHGWPLHSGTFRKILPLLEPHYRCHLVDLPGCGETVWDQNSKAGFREHTDTLKQVVAALGLERYAVLAHDSGGTFARMLAAEDDRVAALVLGNTEIPGYQSKVFETLVRVGQSPIGGIALRTLLRYEFLRRSKLGFAGCFVDMSLIEGEFHDLFVQPLLDSKRMLDGQRLLVDGFEWDALHALDEVHEKVKCPSLLLWGARDPFFPLKYAKPMLSEFAGGAEMVVFDDARLLVHEEKPKEFAQHTHAFLQKHLAQLELQAS